MYIKNENSKTKEKRYRVLKLNILIAILLCLVTGYVFYLKTIPVKHSDTYERPYFTLEDETLFYKITDDELWVYGLPEKMNIADLGEFVTVSDRENLVIDTIGESAKQLKKDEALFECNVYRYKNNNEILVFDSAEGYVFFLKKRERTNDFLGLAADEFISAHNIGKNDIKELKFVDYETGELICIDKAGISESFITYFTEIETVDESIYDEMWKTGFKNVLNVPRNIHYLLIINTYDNGPVMVNYFPMLSFITCNNEYYLISDEFNEWLYTNLNEAGITGNVDIQRFEKFVLIRDPGKKPPYMLYAAFIAVAVCILIPFVEEKSEDMKIYRAGLYKLLMFTVDAHTGKKRVKLKPFWYKK